MSIQLIIDEMRADAKQLDDDKAVSMVEGSCNFWIAKKLRYFANKLEAEIDDLTKEHEF